MLAPATDELCKHLPLTEWRTTLSGKFRVVEKLRKGVEAVGGGSSAVKRGWSFTVQRVRAVEEVGKTTDSLPRVPAFFLSYHRLTRSIGLLGVV